MPSITTQSCYNTTDCTPYAVHHISKNRTLLSLQTSKRFLLTVATNIHGFISSPCKMKSNTSVRHPGSGSNDHSYLLIPAPHPPTAQPSSKLSLPAGCSAHLPLLNLLLPFWTPSSHPLFQSINHCLQSTTITIFCLLHFLTSDISQPDSQCPSLGHSPSMRIKTPSVQETNLN